MTDRAAIAGVFADMKSVKTRSVVQMIVEIPIEQAEAVVQMFGYPKLGAEVPVAVARMVEPKDEEPQRRAEIVGEDKPKRTFDDMPSSQVAALLCERDDFWKYLEWEFAKPCKSNDDAAARVRTWCEVNSRREIDLGDYAQSRFQLMRDRFENWQTDQRYGEHMR